MSETAARQAFGRSDAPPSSGFPWGRRLRAWFGGGPDARSRARLYAALQTYGVELRYRSENFQPTGPSRWTHAAWDLFEMARAAYEANDTETGWACLNASRRMALHGYDDAERGDEARVLSIEIASKCGSWRAAALAALKLEENPTSPRLVLATLLRDDFSQNQWHKLERARIQLRRLTYGLIGAILAFIGLITYLGIPLGGKSEIPLVALALMGVIGGCVSAIQNLGKIAQDVKIPQQAADGFMAFTRPAVGAAAALAAVFLLQLGAISIGGQSNAALFAVCFAAGFSERLVVSGIERVTGK